MSALVVHPTEQLGKIEIEAPDSSGARCVVFVSRWATDVLGCEAWCVLRSVDLAPGVAKSHRSWFTTPAAACAAAVRAFTIAGYGPAPFAPSMLLRRPIAPTGFVLADEVRA